MDHETSPSAEADEIRRIDEQIIDLIRRRRELAAPDGGEELAVRRGRFAGLRTPAAVVQVVRQYTEALGPPAELLARSVLIVCRSTPARPRRLCATTVGVSGVIEP